MIRTLPFAAALVGLVAAQNPGTNPEVHPKLETWKCTVAGGCVSANTAVVIDSGAHSIHLPDSTAACSGTNCVIEGIDDYASHGVTTEGGALKLLQLVNGQSVSPRVYLLEETEMNYEMLQLTGQELSFDVDVSKLPCGMNGALYLSEMGANGGQSEANPAGAPYGTGYCDAQCYTQTFIDGEANPEGHGSCCNEMDIWEANNAATAYAPHPCSVDGVYACTGAECESAGVCDKNGCGYNNYALGNSTFYGPGLIVDTSRPFTVVTQFPATNGILTEIRRLYVQDGKVIQNAPINIEGPAPGDSMTDEFCVATGATAFNRLNGLEGMGGALSRGMVLIFSVWWDTSGFMNWLDSGNAGPCSATEGNPTEIVKVEPNPAVTFSNVKWGEIGSTFSEGN
ncbi:hypothetical protein V499_01951 [Pseudogymnoascus sp. VKM F-103]|nr:hypothetical protein V499_01951 [Pseudogymnoascus sp. VKM F-103]